MFKECFIFTKNHKQKKSEEAENNDGEGKFRLSSKAG